MADSDRDGRSEVGQRTAKGRSERVELPKRAQAAARRVAESKATIPHGYAGRSVPVKGNGERAVAEVIDALARSLREGADLNCSYRDGGLERFSRINVAITVETDDGPLMPTLFDADKMGVDAISQRLEELGDRAERGELTSPELSGATITVGSAGPGSDFLAGTVTPGQAAHLGIGRPRASGEGAAVELTLSFDQRAVRPHEAGALLGRIAARLTAPADDGD